MAEMESLDSKTIVELQELMGDDYLTVYEAFIRSTEAYLSELEAAVKNNDVERIGVILHTLKGSSANIGAVRFSEICKSFMEEAKNNASCDFMTYIHEIDYEYQKIHASIMVLFSRH